MCGLTGFSGKPNSEILEKMTGAIKHRGPDDTAYIVNSYFSVGYRRLAIIDLSENIYPIHNETETIELVLNGEIYNYQTLRRELEALGHEFKTHSDSETIVHGYEQWGYDVVNKLRGMFVFVLYDKEKSELFIARDRLGIKPLYYAQHAGRVIFSSEIKSILAGFDIDRSADHKSVYRFLASRIHDIDENTFFKNIKRLLPGHLMIIDRKSEISIKKYWNPKFNSEFKSRKSDKEYAQEFQEIFTEAVRLHLISDVQVGITLSGGLDSSGIASLAAKNFNEALTLDETEQKKELIAFSAVYPGETNDESKWIDNVIDYTRIKSVKIKPTVDQFWDDLEEWTYFQEEPVISGAPYAYYSVMREARKYVTVFLSGQGGDELLAGYVPYFKSYLDTAVDQKQYWSALRETFKGSDLYLKFFLQKLKQKLDSNLPINPYDTLNKEARSFMPKQFVPSRNLNQRLFEDVTSTTTPCLLRYEDKNSMAHSLESRVPFFDHVVVEYIFNLPIDQKIKNGWNRYIYREAMKGLMPEKNRTRRSKVGFTNPEWEWIERKAGKFKEIFSSESFRSREFWSADKVLEEFNLTINGKKKGDILYFWRLFSVEMWMRMYVDKFELLDFRPSFK